MPVRPPSITLLIQLPSLYGYRCYYTWNNVRRILCVFNSVLFSRNGPQFIVEGSWTFLWDFDLLHNSRLFQWLLISGILSFRWKGKIRIQQLWRPSSFLLLASFNSSSLFLTFLQCYFNNTISHMFFMPRISMYTIHTAYNSAGLDLGVEFKCY